MSFSNFSTGNSHAFGGEYRELVPNEKISYTDKFEDPGMPGEMRTTITLKGVSCGTELTVVDNAGTDDPNDDVTVPAVLDVDLGPGDSFDVSGYFRTHENPPKENVVSVSLEFEGQLLEASSEPTECKALEPKAY